MKGPSDRRLLRCRRRSESVEGKLVNETLSRQDGRPPRTVHGVQLQLAHGVDCRVRSHRPTRVHRENDDDYAEGSASDDLRNTEPASEPCTNTNQKLGKNAHVVLPEFSAN